MKKSANWWLALPKNKPRKLFWVMKLPFLMCVFFATSVSAEVWSQQRLTMRLGETGLKEVFKEIQRQTNKAVVYNDDQLTLSKKVKANFTDVELEEILKQVLQGQGMSYKFMDDYIILVKQPATPQHVEEVTVKGKVTDKEGMPLPGVTIVLKGTTIGTASDVDGNFSLNIPKAGMVLQFSYVGMKNKELTVQGNGEFNIVMEYDQSDLDEVVVIGYGTATKKDLTGAVARFDSKIIEESTATNIAHMMQGQVAGLSILNGDGSPGSAARLEIRGVPSLTGALAPLIVVDNVPMPSDFDINELNPDDVQSIDILKGASSAAIYGSRGAAGVIMITMKAGQRNQKPIINYSYDYSATRLVSDVNTLNADEYKMLFLEAITNSAKADGFEDVNLYPMYQKVTAPGYFGEEDTPWMKHIMRNGSTQQHRLSIRGGSQDFGYYASFGYANEEGMVKATDFQRYTYTLGFDADINKWIKANAKFSGTTSDRHVNGASLSTAAAARPDIPAYNEDGSILEVASADDQAYHNPLRNIDDAWNETRYYGVNFSSYAELDFGQFWEPLKGVKWRTNLGAQYRNSRVGSYYGEGYTNPFKNPAMAPNVANNEHSQKLSWTLENLLYINKTIKDIHSVNITLLQSAERYRTEGLNMRGYEITFPSSLWYNIGASNNAKYAPGSNFSTWSRASYMARVNYGLMDKYLLTVTGRFDGASMLAAGNKWDFFPSAALAWRMEQEKWIQQINWINQLKLRVGYGVTGNSAVNPYQTAGSVTSTYASIPFGVGNVSSNTIGTKTNIMPNYSLGWEKTSSLNVGVDFGVLENRISGSVEYYIAKTSDLLMNQSIPVITGYAQILNNVGKTENRGFEVSLSTVNVKTKDFTWQTDWTFSLNNEKIKELAGGATYDSTGPWMVGEPLNSFYDFQYDRIWQNTQEDNHLMDVYRSLGLTFLPGQYKIVDQPLVEVPQGTEGSKTVEIKDAAGNKTGEVVSYMDNGFGKFDDNDKKIYNKSPKWTGGINNSFTYKNWNLSFFTYFRFGNTYYGLTQTIGRRIEKDTWSPTNTDAKFAQPTTATRETKYDYVRNYTKGNMVLIKNIALSYTVPQSWLKKCGASSAQVYAQVLNPFLFGGELVKAGINPDDLTGWDAGNHIGGQTNNTCITRSLVLGVRLGF